MTTPSTTRKAGPLLGTGAQTAWPFTFKVFATGDVKVTIADTAGTETLLVLDTDYSVALNANQDTSPGGTVTYPISGAALPVGSVLAIVGDLDYDQPLDLPSGGNFSPTALENQLDRSTMQIQQLREEMDRAVKIPATYPAADLEVLTAGIVALAGSTDEIVIVAANVADIATVADDLNEPVSEINTVAGSIANVDAVGGSIASVNTVAGITANVNTVAGIAANVTTVAGVSTGVTTVAGISADVAAVENIAADVTAVAGVSAGVAAISIALPEINTVASDLAGTGYDYDLGSITTPSTGASTSPTSAILAVAAVAGDLASVIAIAADVPVVAAIAADVSAVAAVAPAVAVAAANVADITNFSDVYQGGSATDPLLRNDGTALVPGDLYLNTATPMMRVYTSGGWADSVSPDSVTITPQTFSGDGTTTAFALSSTPSFEAACDVYLSGVAQTVNTDYNIVDTSLVFTTAPPIGTNNIYVKTLSSYVGGVPPDASITSAKLASTLDLGAL